MSGWRLPVGGRIDRSRPMAFRWGGRSLTGFAGDTLASALLANGVDIVGRSFKYHRPRGLLAAAIEEPNGIVQLEEGAHTIPNLKTTQIELYEGLAATPVNAWPSAEWDLLGVISLFKRFIPAAFYYKTFTWPHWQWFEPMIRKAAGLGRAPAERDPDRYEHRFAHVDTLVVGSGAAGLAAAISAGQRGERVLLVEMDAELGGGLLAEPGLVEGLSAEAWRQESLEALAGMANVTILPRTMAFGFYDHALVALAERLSDHLPVPERTGPRQRLWKVRCGRAIMATGAFERPLAFAGNDLPGVMLANAAQTYALRYGVASGRRIVVVTNNDSGYQCALALAHTGAQVCAVIDSRAEPGGLIEKVQALGIQVHTDQVPIRAKGRRAVRAIVVEPIGAKGQQQSIPCDAVLMAGGWNPAVHLHSQSGGRLAFDTERQAFLPSERAQASVNVGAAAGIFELGDAIVSARAAGQEETPPPVPVISSCGPKLTYSDGDPAAGKAWLDLQNDVTVGDVQLAVRENFRSVEHVKRYTTLGMASDQGKTSNVAGIAAIAELLGKSPGEIGTTKFRPPFDPVPIGAFAGCAVGDALMPLAHTPSEAAALQAGGIFENYGGWSRAAYFARTGEDEHSAIHREVLTVRGTVGLFDASPLGKIEVKGLDAAEFLDRMYINQVKTLKVGHCRYGLMLNENGVVFDDGVFARITDDCFLVGTTSGHAAAIAESFEEWLQCEWPHLKVLVENVTTGWAVMNVAGPMARAVLAAVGTDIDLSPEAFPHMTFRAGEVCGVPARIQRVSFSGELSYEIAVPWGYGSALWDALMQAGAERCIAPFGIEALMAMRIEKGFLHVGSDTDGMTLPQDIGFGAIVAKKVGDFVGRRSTMRPDGLRSDRHQLVGLEITDFGGAVNAGAHVLPAEAREAKGTDGYVTSSVLSPTLGRPIAMALVRQGQARIGQSVHLWDMGMWREARIADPRFYDPQSQRVNG